MAKRGRKSTLEDKPRYELLIPSTIFVGTKLTIFEAVVKYLKEERKLSFRQIGYALDRDERNVWTVYHRAKKK